MQPADLILGDLLPITRRLALRPPPARLFDRLLGGADAARDALLLESADDSAGSGGKSLLALRCALRITCRGDQVSLEALSAGGAIALAALAAPLKTAVAPVTQRDDGRALHLHLPPRPPCVTDAERLRAPSSLDVLRVVRQRFRVRSRPVDPPFYLAGAFSYDLIDQFESLPPAPRDPHGFPDWVFWLPEVEVRVDHRASSATVLVHVFGGGPPTLYHDAVAELDRVVTACESGPASGPPKAPEEAPDEAPEAPRASQGAAVNLDDSAYAAVVEQLKGHIVAGDVFQIVPSRTFARPCSAPFDAYQRLRALNPSPYLFYLAHPDWTLFGASPETSVKVEVDEASPPKTRAKAGSGARSGLTLTLKPIAGTRPRGRTPDGRPDPDLDTRLEAELRQDDKEQAEHLMLVDLARNDVARVSQPGTRAVTRLLTVERYSHVMHLVSTVTGRLQPDLDALHAYAACLNMGTLVGAPKLRAAALLRTVEPTRRGPYGGAVGYLASDGSLDTAIVIRSALVQQGVAHVQAGAGVVHDSVPQAEADETARKAAAVLAALDAATASSAPEAASEDAAGGDAP